MQNWNGTGEGTGGKERKGGEMMVGGQGEGEEAEGEVGEEQRGGGVSEREKRFALLYCF